MLCENMEMGANECVYVFEVKLGDKGVEISRVKDLGTKLFLNLSVLVRRLQ